MEHTVSSSTSFAPTWCRTPIQTRNSNSFVICAYLFCCERSICICLLLEYAWQSTCRQYLQTDHQHPGKTESLRMEVCSSTLYHIFATLPFVVRSEPFLFNKATMKRNDIDCLARVQVMSTLPNSTIITANTNLTCKTTSISVCPSDFFVQKTGSKSSKQKTTIQKCVHSFAFVHHLKEIFRICSTKVA